MFQRGAKAHTFRTNFHNHIVLYILLFIFTETALQDVYDLLAIFKKKIVMLGTNSHLLSHNAYRKD